VNGRRPKPLTLRYLRANGGRVAAAGTAGLGPACSGRRARSVHATVCRNPSPHGRLAAGGQALDLPDRHRNRRGTDHRRFVAAPAPRAPQATPARGDHGRGRRARAGAARVPRPPARDPGPGHLPAPVRPAVGARDPGRRAAGAGRPARSARPPAVAEGARGDGVAARAGIGAQRLDRRQGQPRDPARTPVRSQGPAGNGASQTARPAGAHS